MLMVARPSERWVCASPLPSSKRSDPPLPPAQLQEDSPTFPPPIPHLQLKEERPPPPLPPIPHSQLKEERSTPIGVDEATHTVRRLVEAGALPPGLSPENVRGGLLT